MKKILLFTIALLFFPPHLHAAGKTFLDKIPSTNVIKILKKNGVYSQSGSDEEKRAVFVGLQTAMENVFDQELKKDPQSKLMVVFLTPAPITPLCTAAENISEGLIHERLKKNKAIEKTVSSRAKTVRNLLVDGAQIYVLYQKGGLWQRTAEQQKIYLAEVKKHKVNLHSKELKTPFIQPEMIGALYLFQNAAKESSLFFIQATQANKPGDNPWQVGFGTLENQAMKDRFYSVLDYLGFQGQKNVKEAFEKRLH